MRNKKMNANLQKSDDVWASSKASSGGGSEY